MPVAKKSSNIDVFAMDDDSEYESEGEGDEAITGIKRKIDVELSEYKKMARLEMREKDRDGVDGAFTNPLLWWKSNSTQIPTIAKIARKFLCIPATSAPSERVFSVAGLVISKLRSNLTPENASCIIMLRESKKVIAKWYKKLQEKKKIHSGFN
jgi:hypothetical protein